MVQIKAKERAKNKLLSIYWQKNEIEVFIILCFKNFYSILTDEDLLNNLKKCEDKNKIIEVFIRGGNIDE